jgi:hypothetical protein
MGCGSIRVASSAAGDATGLDGLVAGGAVVVTAVVLDSKG